MDFLHFFEGCDPEEIKTEELLVNAKKPREDRWKDPRFIMDDDDDDYEVDDDEDLDLDYGMDPDDLDEVELDDLKGALDSVVEDEDDLDDSIDDIEDPVIEPLLRHVPEEELSPEERKVASDMIATSVPSMLVKTELDATESAEFFTSEDADIAVYEGLMDPEFVDKNLKELSTTISIVEEATFPTSNKTIVRFSKQALINRIHGICVMKVARAHRDKDAVAYAKFNAKRKFYKAKLKKKYDREADRQTRLVIARMRKSKSPVIKKLSNKVD